MKKIEMGTIFRNVSSIGKNFLFITVTPNCLNMTLYVPKNENVSCPLNLWLQFSSAFLTSPRCRQIRETRQGANVKLIFLQNDFLEYKLN